VNSDRKTSFKITVMNIFISAVYINFSISYKFTSYLYVFWI